MGALLSSYIRWHYTAGIRDLVGVLYNMAWAIGNLFSIRILLGTLLAPLKRIHEEPASLLKDPALFFQNLLVNTLMRIVGLIVRLGCILIACALWVLLFLFTILFLSLWLVLPVLPIALIGWGSVMLFSI